MVTHERGEIELKEGAFRLTWKLVLCMRPMGHVLSIAAIEPHKPEFNVAALRRALEATVAKAMSTATGIVLPEVREYMSASYFNWK